MPSFVARAIDNTTQPLRAARQVFEEVEEITFSLKRTRKVTLKTESTDSGEQATPPSTTAETPSPTGRIASSREPRAHGAYHRPAHGIGSREQYSSPRRLAAKDVEGLSLGSAEGERRRELTERDGPRELRPPEGPRQLPPAE